MKQLLLICAVVALGGCWKKEAPWEENRVRVQRSTPYQELPKAAVGKLIADPIVEKAIREKLNMPTGELTKADYEKVTELVLNHSNLTNAKGLEKLTQLKELNLHLNKLTDVAGLEKLTQLTDLYLHVNQLTDVRGLEKLTQLEDLWLEDNPDFTKAQIDKLKRSLPNCNILSDFK